MTLSRRPQFKCQVLLCSSQYLEFYMSELVNLRSQFCNSTDSSIESRTCVSYLSSYSDQIPRSSKQGGGGRVCFDSGSEW